jgi:hypothetical protein
MMNTGAVESRRPDERSARVTLMEAVEAGWLIPDVDFPVSWSGDMPIEEAMRRINADAYYASEQDFGHIEFGGEA